MALRRPTADELGSGTPEELAQLAAECLARLEPGRQPLPLFTQLARIVVLSTVEVVPFRLSPTKLEVLLGRRTPDDLWWPNQWNVPGIVLSPTDEERDNHDYVTPGERILSTEFHNTVRSKGDVHVFDAQRRTGPRGSEQTVFCWAEVDVVEGHTQPSGGQFFDALEIVTDPPPDLVEGHAATIEQATAYYLNS